MNTAKDSDEVITFMVLFHKLRDRIGDDPNVLKERAKDDENIQQICNDLRDAYHSVWRRKGRQRGFYAAPVDPKFMEAMRYYEAEYKSIIFNIIFDKDDDDSGPVKKGSEFDILWESADEDADIASYAIESAINFAKEHIKDMQARPAFTRNGPGNTLAIATIPAIALGSDVPEEFLSAISEMGWIGEGAYAWNQLAEETGFNLRDVFRRKRLVPFVLIPTHVSDGHGSAEKLSLFTNLQQAQEAFIFGVPFAALALIRSITEVTLKTHYQAPGANLSEMIENCKNLPDGCQKGVLRGIRELANVILHVDKDKVDKHKVRLPDDFEEKIWNLLNALRALIEGAPTTRR